MQQMHELHVDKRKWCVRGHELKSKLHKVRVIKNSFDLRSILGKFKHPYCEISVRNAFT